MVSPEEIPAHHANHEYFTGAAYTKDVGDSRR